jgi:hypothetical protein
MILGAVRSNDCLTRDGWGVINGIRADPHSFTGTYVSVEKDTVAYGLRMWVHMHDTWVLWEGHGMVRMLLTGRTNVAKRGCSWLGADRRGRRSSKGWIVAS